MSMHYLKDTMTHVILPVENSLRSRMNIVFNFKNEKNEQAFIKESLDHGIIGIKGHRSVGGVRISLYNSIDRPSVDYLLEIHEFFFSKIMIINNFEKYNFKNSEVSGIITSINFSSEKDVEIILHEETQDKFEQVRDLETVKSFPPLVFSTGADRDLTNILNGSKEIKKLTTIRWTPSF